MVALNRVAFHRIDILARCWHSGATFSPAAAAAAITYSDIMRLSEEKYHAIDKCFQIRLFVE